MPTLILFILLVFITPAHAGQVIKGPVLCDVVRVIDGDTLDVTYSQGGHREKLGRAIWVFKHLEKIADRKTRAGATKMRHLTKVLQVSRATAQRHLAILRKHGYISTRQVQHGFEFEILKSANMVVHQRIRIDGVNTPETRTRCIPEKEAGIRSREFLAEQLKGKQVYLMNIRDGKFAGRQLARAVIAGTGKDITDLLIEHGHGKPYGGGKRRGWCE